jgi:hypothetical protein
LDATLLIPQPPKIKVFPYIPSLTRGARGVKGGARKVSVVSIEEFGITGELINSVIN